MSMRAFDLVGTIHGREYSDHGEYVTAQDHYDLMLYSEAVDRLKLLLEQDMEKLKAENESMRKDAGRYRWIKKESNLSDYEDCYSLPMVHAWEYKPGPELNEQFESLDAAIDHAISSPENP